MQTLLEKISKNFKKNSVIVLILSLLALTLFQVMEHNKANNPQKSQVLQSSPTPKTLPEPKTIVTANSKYAKALTAEQVSAINAMRLPPTNPPKPIPASELPPPSDMPKNNNTGRCLYNGQDYALGDIVKAEIGWIRCTPTITFNGEKPTLAQPASSAWTKVQ